MHPAFISMVLLTISGAAPSRATDPTFPPDVVKFLHRRELCDHFRGEEPYDDERRRFLIERINETCTGTDQELAGLKKKYANTPLILEKLAGFDEITETRP